MPAVLWHLKVSHYNEKARWALDLKGVPHLRRALVPGRHQRAARRLTGGRTFPVLVLDGAAIGESSRIIETLEQRYPQPPLYPIDPEERRRARRLEAFFDEELGPHIRLLVVHHMLPDAKLTLGTFVPDLGHVGRLAAQAGFPGIRRQMTATLSIDERSVAVAWEKVQAAGARFRAELQPSGYLASDGFNVADLTLAALLSPAVAPPEFPYPQPQRDHPRLAPLRDLLDSEGLSAWTRGIYARHRGTSAEVAAAPPTCPPNQEFRVLSQGEPRGRQQRRSRHC